MADAGLGRVEVAYVYPLALRPPSSVRLVLANLRFAADRAHELGSASTSRWAAAGPSADRTSSGAGGSSAALGAARDRAGTGGRARRPPWPGDDLVAGYVGAGSLQEHRWCTSGCPSRRSVDHRGRDGSPGRPARLLAADRAERQARGSRGGGSGARPLLRGRRRGASAGGRRPDARRRPGRAGRVGLLRQPRGVRRRLDHEVARGVRPASRLRPPPPAPPIDVDGPTRYGSAPTTTAPWPSCTRRTSSLCASAGRRGAECRFGSSATGRRRHDQQLPVRGPVRG